MKKILYTLFSLFVLASCTHDELDIPAPLQQESGEKVKLTFNVNIPEAQSVETRAFGESATLKTLWLVLFDEFGYYVGKAQAKNATDNSSNTIGNVTMDNPDTEGLDVTPFYVELNVTKSPRIIHFIGNYDLANATLAGHENAIISRLNVTGGQDAYWQRIDVDEIAKKDDAVADENGSFEGKLPTEMDPVYLLRNFAKITVEKATDVTSSFIYTGFDIITTESHGSVAPYNVATDPASFPTFISNGNTCVSYQSLLDEGYTGFIPGASTHQNTFNKEAKNFSATPSFSAEAQYLYERNNADGQTYVIVKGTWNKAETYYKIDLIREVEGSAVTYFHILRNFHYKIVIRSVEGAGADTPQEAAAGAASNNIFASVELQHLTNIGDGEARLFVNYTSKTLISNAPVTLEFNFLNESGDAANDRIALQEGNEADVFASIEGPYDVGDRGYDESLVENTGYSYYIITPKSPGTLPLDESLTLYDKGTTTVSATGLQRKVEYTLRKAYPLSATCNSPVADDMGSSVDVSISIDDDLPSYLFPLTFYIESSALSIYPDASQNNMPVNNRTTIVEGKTGNSFGFDRVLTWTEYETLKESASNEKVSVPCHFLTNMDNSASDIYVYNDLFELGKCNFTTERITYSSLTIKAGSLSITNNMNNNSGRTVTIHTSNPDDSSNASNIGSSTFTKTAPSNDITLTLNPALRSSDIIYFRYSTTSGWGRTTYYIASATIRDLLNATADNPLSLTFEEV